jgi:hypothetical protein
VLSSVEVRNSFQCYLHAARKASRTVSSYIEYTHIIIG